MHYCVWHPMASVFSISPLPAASSWWNLALLISISDLLDTASFIIQGKPGDEATVDILPTEA